ncbi:MAG: helicase-associated domain-containing protein, partial [Chloroflexota bacterium]|nr:helicase-associated domain-containing protein [Chloroflexota bacterium]
EIAHPGEVAATLPLRPLQPIPANTAPDLPEPEPHMLAWDLLTLLREIAEHGAPVWIPGEPLSRTWQRRLNRRLWLGGNEVPPRGYLGFLLYLGATVGVVRASDDPLPSGTDRNAIRPEVGPGVREWTRLTFAVQTERLKEAWLDSDVWIEGREREEIDVWGADWRGFRRHLLDAIAELDPDAWFMVDDLAARLAEQNPTMIGTTFTAASSRASRGGADERNAAIAQIIEVELETALSWLSIIQLGVAAGSGEVVTPVAVRDVPDEAAAAGPSLTVTDEGLVTLRRPTPLHVWSLSAFGDAEALRPAATYQLRPGSVSRALAAGFDLDQITAYLSSQSAEALPELLAANLRDWTVGYKRVRMRRAVVLKPESDGSIPELRDALAAAGVQVMNDLTPEGDLIVLLDPATDISGQPEDLVLAALRAHGHVGQWETTRHASRHR